MPVSTLTTSEGPWISSRHPRMAEKAVSMTRIGPEELLLSHGPLISSEGNIPESHPLRNEMSQDDYLSEAGPPSFRSEKSGPNTPWVKSHDPELQWQCTSVTEIFSKPRKEVLEQAGDRSLESRKPRKNRPGAYPLPQSPWISPRPGHSEWSRLPTLP